MEMEKIENLHFAKYTQNYSANISSTMNPLEAVLYSNEEEDILYDLIKRSLL